MSVQPVKILFTLNDKVTQKVGKIQNRFVALNKTISKTAQKTEKASRAFRRQTSVLRRYGRQAKNLGRSMSFGLTLPIAAFGGAAILATNKFQTAMNEVEAMTGATGESLKALTGQAKMLGITTQFSASEAAEGMAFLGRAGWETQDILKGMPGLLNLAAASKTDLGQAADIASNIMGAFNIKASESGRVADVLANVTASANVNMDQLADTMKFTAPIAKQFGVSLEDTAAAAGLLGNIGIQGSTAGTAMKNMFLKLAAPSAKANKILNKLGVTIADAKGNIKPFAEIMSDLGSSFELKGFSQVEQIQALNEILGKRALAGGSDLLKRANSGELITFMKRMGESEGAAKRIAETLMKGIPGAIKLANSAIEGLFLAISDSGFGDFVNSFVRGFAVVAQGIAKANPKLLKFITILGGVAAIAGPLVFIFGSIGLLLLTLLAPVALIFIKIMAIVAIVSALYVWWEDIVGLIKSAFNWLINGEGIFARIMRILPFITGPIGILVGLSIQIYKNWDLIVDSVSAAFSWISKIVSATSGFVGGVFGKLFGGSAEINTNQNQRVTVANPTLQSSIQTQNNAAVRVDFANAPQGTSVTPLKNDGISLETGLIFGGGF